MIAVAADPYAHGALKQEFHSRIVANLTNFAEDAAVQPRHITHRMGDVPERAFVVRHKFHPHEGISGLVLTGEMDDVEERMAAMAGAYIRNFVRARVITVNTLADMFDDGNVTDISVLLVPNFYVDKISSGLPSWKVANLYDALLQRHQAGKQSVLYVSNMDAMAKDYGKAVRKHLGVHYSRI